MARKSRNKDRERLFSLPLVGGNNEPKYTPLTQNDDDDDGKYSKRRNNNNNNKKSESSSSSSNMVPSSFPLDDDGDDDYNPSSFLSTQLQQQANIVAKQDRALDVASESIQRIKSITIDIGDELDEQNQMLDHMEDEVSRTQGMLRRTTQRLDKLLSRGGDSGKICIIFILLIVLIGLIFGVVNL